MQVGDDVRAESTLAQATKLVPGEPAAWANWGILALRQRNFDAAAQRFDKAKSLDRADDRVYYLQGLLESDRGNSSQAINDFRDAVKRNPKNLRAIYLLASEVERQGGDQSDAQYERLMQQLLSVDPTNVAALLDLARVAAKRGDAATLRTAVAAVDKQSGAWPPEVKQQLDALKASMSGSDVKPAATRSIFLRNVLMRVPEFRANLLQLKPQPGDEAQPFTHFVKLENPKFSPAPPDTAMRFVSQPVKGLAKGGWEWIGAISLDGTGAPVTMVADAHQVQLSTGAKLNFPGGSGSSKPLPAGIVPIDFNYDFKTDLVLAGAGGIHFYRQDKPDAFVDVTAATKLPPAVLRTAYNGAWPVDIEADGDLDIVAAPAVGPLVVLRNNGDGTFAVTHPFANVIGVRQFVWADLNGDGNPDAALIDGAGHLHVFLNQRSGNFREEAVPSEVVQVKAIAAADLDHAGPMSLAVVRSDGQLESMNLPAENGAWATAKVNDVTVPADFLSGDLTLSVGDFDNNGAIDLLIASTSARQEPQLWLQSKAGHFQRIDTKVDGSTTIAAADVEGNGRLDLLTVSTNGEPLLWANQGTKGYHWQTIRPRARQTTGDQRVNSFGVGGEIEIRSGLLPQKQTIMGPELHFGLGTQTGADVARIIWPNGSVRAEFALKADQAVLTEQRLKGSCPFLFAYNGKEMAFVKDTVPWGAAIGLRINAIGPAKVGATEEWYKIRGDQLVPHDGYYDLRITGELWETYYYDSLWLMAVDHPAGTEIYTDERYQIPAVKLAITTTEEPHPIAKAVDDSGKDVTGILSKLDGTYLDNFGRGQYQGVTRDHYVEIDLGQDFPERGPVWLIAKGWLHPSDSSLNIAMGQGHHEVPRPLSMEIPDRNGDWKTVKNNLGFPAGRNKTCLFDLTGLFPPGTPHKLRLRTNLEIYWDSIEWAKGVPSTTEKVTRLETTRADLHYRGYSEIHQANASSPEIPDYEHLASTTQIWRDLSGYYTRYGDVRELLSSIDDRYVIMNAGDELSLRFAALAPPAEGWVRDYVIAGDGWIKDGDYNSTFSSTVLPYPYHARKEYDQPPRKLEDEWVYRHHPQDWQTYQTRYVTPEIFEDALRSKGNE
ncbi:FG-GAP-like repeat-containing protein [Acidicapsa dinghuensis]|uniref:FG-GAP-like repeat-containing protein n=1 Tax=Acidicapsa dinghuensis TaxID=2218256 RepID=A0ABW1EDP6_9BACT|nr:FG-GAP-like repeat-containing protein [Acidicapsa dinghuensis]